MILYLLFTICVVLTVAIWCLWRIVVELKLLSSVKFVETWKLIDELNERLDSHKRAIKKLLKEREG